MSLTLYQFWKYYEDICFVFSLVQCPSVLTEILCGFHLFHPHLSESKRTAPSVRGEHHLCFSDAFIVADVQNLNEGTKTLSSLYAELKDVSSRHHEFVSDS